MVYDARESTKRRTDHFQLENNTAFRKPYTCFNIIDARILTSPLYWQSNLIQCSFTDYPGTCQEFDSVHSAPDSFTFHLESGVTKLSLLAAFPRRKILEEFPEGGKWTCAIGLLARKREKKTEKERLKGTTYGTRGSGRTRVEHSKDTRVQCPVSRNFVASALRHEHVYTYRKRSSMKTANEPLFKINRWLSRSRWNIDGRVS